MNKRKKNKLTIGAIVLLLVPVFILNTRIKLPFSLYSYSEVLPHKKWILARETDGQLTINLMDYQTGLTKDFRVTQFQRGESMMFASSQGMSEKKVVSVGDTIGYFYSSGLDERIVQLQGELEVAKADLALNNTGEKKSLIEEAENRLKFSEAKLREKKNLFKRTEQLFKKGFVTEEFYEMAQSEIAQLEIEAQIYRSQLDAKKTGTKPESIQFLKARINSIEKELTLLLNRSKSSVILSPINGMVNRSFSRDTIISVIDIDKIILNIPLKLSLLQNVHEGDSIQVELNSSGESKKGNIIFISKQVTFLQRQQVVNVTIIVDNSSHLLLPGMIVEARLILKPITIAEHIRNFLMN